MGKVRRSRQRNRRRGTAEAAGFVATERAVPRRRADLDAFVARFPQPAPLATALSLASVVFGNAYLGWRVWQGDLRMSGVVLLVLVEAVVLALLATAQRHSVPAADRTKPAQEHYGLPHQVLSWIATIIAVGGAYAIWFWFLGETRGLRELFRSPDPWTDAGLHIALGITLVFAVAGLVADHLHYRRAGPPLLSSVELESTARRITFVYGALVMVIPVFGTLPLAVWVLKRLLAGRDTKAWNFFGGVSLIAILGLTVFGFAKAVESGPLGWALVYLWGKTLVEGMFVMMPLLARRAAAANGKPVGAPFRARSEMPRA